MKKIISALIAIIVIAIAVGAAYVVKQNAVVTDPAGSTSSSGGTSNNISGIPGTPSATVANFDVTYNGEAITDDLILYKGDASKFEIVYDKDVTEKFYSVKIVPNIRFEYTVSGSAMTLSENQDVTGAFDLSKTKDFFTLTLSEDDDAQTLINKLYPDKKVSVNKKYKDSAIAFWRIIVSNKAGETVKSFNFGVGIRLDSITLPETLEF